MCGITGAVWREQSAAIEPAVLERMTAVLAHRGPDDQGAYTSDIVLRPGQNDLPGVALGHRRLSILDVACSRQPISNEDGSVWLVFNGEIYNYRELRRRLEGAGHRFRTEGDTETLVHLYEDEGPAMLEHLLGMFALAIWDACDGTLLLARDRLGKKPLVYRQEANRLLFASELKSLLEVPGLPREVDPSAVDEYLTYQYVPHPNCILRGYKKLPPGHYAIHRNGQLDVRSYWSPDFNAEVALPVEEYRTELRRLLRSSVELRLQSDVPVGAFLSGGIDSSVVALLMRHLHDGPVRTFSIGFSDASHDETAYAREVAQALGTEHHEFRVEPDAIDILPKLVWHFDEPFADSSAVPTYYLSQLARQHVTVALTGDGGDELFAGYDRYRAAWLGTLFDRLPGPVRWTAGHSAWQSLPGGRAQRSSLHRFRRLAEALRLSGSRRYAQWMMVFDEARRAALYSDELLSRLPDADPHEFLDRNWRRASRRDEITRASLTDLVTYLPGDLLTKVDIASMAHGLECRQPLLDHRVVELAIRMPAEYKFARGRGKRILRDLFAGELPPSVFRRRKMGFGVPLARWFREDLRDYVRDVLLDPASLARGYFRPAAIQTLLEEHQQARFDHSHRLWALLVFELWQRQWLNRRE